MYLCVFLKTQYLEIQCQNPFCPKLSLYVFVFGGVIIHTQ